MKQEIYVIGDVHGCYHSLLDLLEILPRNSRKIFVGDLCDRGLYSKEVFELVINNNYECVLGNHDQQFVDFAEVTVFKEYKNYWTNENTGGAATIKSYNNDFSLLKKHVEWVKTLPTYILVDNVFITHGFGLYYFKHRFSPNNKSTFLTNRDLFECELTKSEVFNIFGHIPYKKPNMSKSFCGIDTGCVYGDELSAIEIYSKKVVSVPSNQKDINNDIK